MLSTLDAVCALIVCALLLTAVFINQPKAPRLLAKKVEYQELARKVLLKAVMEGYVENLKKALRNNSDPTPILHEMVDLAPEDFKCGIRFESSSAKIWSVGCWDQEIYGDATYLLREGILWCRIGE